MKCRITYHGAGCRKSLHLGASDCLTYFSPKNKLISIIIDDTEGHTTLQPDFFGKVHQIRTLYPTKEYGGINLLVDWIEDNNLKLGDQVELQVVVPFKKFRLRKIK